MHFLSRQLRVVFALLFLAAVASLLTGAAPDATVASTRGTTESAGNLAAYAAMENKLVDDDVEGRLTLARSARDHKMWLQAAAMAEAALYRDPGNRAAYLILQQIDEARPLPEDVAKEEALKLEFQKKFSHDFKTRVTRHFLLCYDTTDAFAAQRGATMERVYDSFQFYFNMDKLRPQFLERRLDVVLFKDREDYLAYAKQSEGADLSWSSGFYSQGTNRSAFFDDSSGLTAASFAKQADALHAKIDDLTREINAATAQSQQRTVNQLSVERARAGEALAQMTTRMGNTVLMMNNSKTLHEAAHQISFNTGIQRRLVDYPLWLSEGLACSFEVEDGAGRKGPAILNYGRIGGIKEALRAGTLMSVKAFITQAKPEKIDDASLSLFYCEGWGLFHYLYKYQRKGMESYLTAYNAHLMIRGIGPEERQKLFIAAFGDNWDDLDKKFAAYMKSLPAKPQ